VGSVEKPEEEERPSAARSAAKETAADVALDALGAGVAGHAARNYMHASNGSTWSRASGPRVTLAAGARFLVFLHEAASLE
jgi:hypothetical protein